MKLIVQRVQKSAVTVGDKTNSAGPGLFCLLGIDRYDGQADVEALARKMMNVRVFSAPKEGAAAKVDKDNKNDDDTNSSSGGGSGSGGGPAVHDPFDGGANSKPWAASVMDSSFDVMIVSQFTLCHEMKGNKPDFHCAMGGDKAQELFQKFVAQANKHYDDFCGLSKGNKKQNKSAAAAEGSAAAAAAASATKKRGVIQTGFFGEHMFIDVRADGPVTLTLESEIGIKEFEKKKQQAAAAAVAVAATEEEEAKKKAAVEAADPAAEAKR